MAGRKPVNQDCAALRLPEGLERFTKGVALALADGVSSSEVSQQASKAAVEGFLADYYCTPEAWSVKSSALSVLRAINAWLHTRTLNSPHRYERERGYVCTFSALVLKGRQAHLFHVGDSRIYRLRDGAFEQLTTDHRGHDPEHGSFLARALGVGPSVDIDYRCETLRAGDVFLLATDGVYEYLDWEALAAALAAPAADFDALAVDFAVRALAAGSPDNLSLQLLRVEALPPAGAHPDLFEGEAELPPAPLLEARAVLDGYRVLRPLHVSSRSHVYLAEDGESGELVALKVPSMDLRGDPAYLKRFMLEEWIARRIDNPQVLRPAAQTRPRSALYVVTEYLEGQTLAQWMLDHPRPSLERVRGLIEQIARGLQAFHRLEMLHQDLRPANVIIDARGTAKIIDFGAVWVSGLAEAAVDGPPQFPGTAQYMAPEYFLGEPASPRSDIFSLGVIAYHMLSGRLPYGTELAKARTKAAQRRLQYRSVLDEEREIPAWVDAALAKAVAIDPYKRYGELSEFLHDLRQPPHAVQGVVTLPLIERHPLRFWQGLSAVLLLVVVALLGVIARAG